jgi:hypothetical protein
MIHKNIFCKFFMKIYIKLFAYNFKLNFENIAKSFIEEKQTYEFLKNKFKTEKTSFVNNRKEIIIYNPGGGSDITTLLLLLDTFTNKYTNLKIIIQEIRDYSDGIIEELKKFTVKPVICKNKNKNKIFISAFYKNKTIEIVYYLEPIENLFPIELKKGYDIYYERAFELFRSNNNEFFYNCKKHLILNGLMISDYGFNFDKNNIKCFKKITRIPKEYGLYNNLEFWQKIKTK